MLPKIQSAVFFPTRVLDQDKNSGKKASFRVHGLIEVQVQQQHWSTDSRLWTVFRVPCLGHNDGDPTPGYPEHQYQGPVPPDSSPLHALRQTPWMLLQTKSQVQSHSRCLWVRGHRMSSYSAACSRGLASQDGLSAIYWLLAVRQPCGFGDITGLWRWGRPSP